MWIYQQKKYASNEFTKKHLFILIFSGVLLISTIAISVYILPKIIRFLNSQPEHQKTLKTKDFNKAYEFVKQRIDRIVQKQREQMDETIDKIDPENKIKSKMIWKECKNLNDKEFMSWTYNKVGELPFFNVGEFISDRQMQIYARSWAIHDICKWGWENIDVAEEKNTDYINGWISNAARLNPISLEAPVFFVFGKSEKEKEQIWWDHHDTSIMNFRNSLLRKEKPDNISRKMFKLIFGSSLMPPDHWYKD